MNSYWFLWSSINHPNKVAIVETLEGELPPQLEPMANEATAYVNAAVSTLEGEYASLYAIVYYNMGDGSYLAQAVFVKGAIVWKAK